MFPRISCSVKFFEPMVMVGLGLGPGHLLDQLSGGARLSAAASPALFAVIAAGGEAERQQQRGQN